jgi:hypothetical protein
MSLFKSTLCFLIVAITASSLPAQLSAVPGDQRGTDRDAIREHIGQIFEAYIHADRATIQATHSDEWRGYISTSREIIRGIDQYMHAADNIQKATRMTGYKIVDIDIVFYGDVAVVPYIAQVELSIGGTRIASKLRVLDVYAKMNGNWIQVASNTVTHPDSQAAFEQQPFPLSAGQKQGLLSMREAVWRAYFSNDRNRLEQMIPNETIAIDADEEPWLDRDRVLAGADKFAKSGGKLTRLEFPKTEIQMYGPIAILYSTYQFEIEVNGAKQTQSGRASEIFVNRQGTWVNAGWHLDSRR